MTAATIISAARLLADVPASEIVSLTEIGSEGSVLRIGPRTSGPGSSFKDNTWLIARDGTAQSNEGEWMLPDGRRPNGKTS